MTQAVILGLEGPELGRDEAAFFREADPWGFILFARNVAEPEQLTRLSAQLRACIGRDAPILVDQEGGRVQRLRAPHWHEWMPPLDQAHFPDPERAFWLRGRLIGAELRAVGIDCDCAPGCDIAQPDTHPFLRNRCPGETADEVSRNARAMAEGLLAAGVLPVIKHMPGHGRATADSHKDLPHVEASRAELAASDFAPFRALADLPMAMTAHIRFSAIDPAHPATQSAAMVSLIREEIGFGGLLVSDDLSMQALAGSLGARTRATMAAGCDMALHCNGQRAEMEQVLAEVPVLAGPALARAEAALERRIAPADDTPAHLADLMAQYEALVAEGADG